MEEENLFEEVLRVSGLKKHPLREERTAVNISCASKLEKKSAPTEFSGGSPLKMFGY